LDISIAQRYIRDNDSLLACLSSLPITLGCGTRPKMIAQELNALLKAASRDYLAIVEKATLVIYGIRNNLFHGDYDPASDTDQQHVDTAERSLSSLLKEIIACHILSRPLSTTRFAADEKLAF
jgi:hypothetical protein